MKKLLLGAGPLFEALKAPDLILNPYLEVLNLGALASFVKQEQVSELWFLPAENLSARELWCQNTEALINILEVAAAQKLEKVFWLSSLQESHTEPTSISAISKRAGEDWCRHYAREAGVDIRVLRLPQLLTQQPQNALNDYVHEMLNAAGDYTCYLKEDSCLPMIYLPDAVAAIKTLMASSTARGMYDIAALNFAPCDLAAALQKTVSYRHDHRQAQTKRWPLQINDQRARNDWRWAPRYHLQTLIQPA